MIAGPCGCGPMVHHSQKSFEDYQPKRSRASKLKAALKIAHLQNIHIIRIGLGSFGVWHSCFMDE